MLSWGIDSFRLIQTKRGQYVSRFKSSQPKRGQYFRLTQPKYLEYDI